MFRSRRTVGVALTAALLGAAVAFGVAQYASASGGNPSGPPAQAASQATPRDYVETHLKYKATYIAEGSSGTLTANTFNPLHSAIAFKCSKACLVVAHESGQFASGASFTDWAMCAASEAGLFTEPSCPYDGLALANGTFDTRAFSQTMHLAKGNHTVTLFVFPDNVNGSMVRYVAQFDVYET